MAVVCAAIAGRVLVADRFLVPSDSMYPTLQAGDRIWVNKLLYGPRIYRRLDFQEHAPLECFRLPGLRKIRPGDVIVFNFPFGYDDWSRIEFRINYVYCKRVAGAPGNVIGIRDGFTWNDSYDGILGVPENQKELSETDDSTLALISWYDAVPLSYPVWNVKNLGPMTVPAKGMTVSLDTLTRALYSHVIRYESGENPDLLDSYTFTHDWYFAMGDNSTDSRDSRFWGFIPDEFVVGIVSSCSLKGRNRNEYGRR